ncbi:hypothetical protein BDV18DRAFT_160442 [Aspergillus unguis]
MRFTLASTLSMAAVASAAIPASQMTANINTIADQSSQATKVAKSISSVNVFDTGPELINDLKQIATTIAEDNNAMNPDKRSLQARQFCDNAPDLEACLENIAGIVDDSAELLGKSKKMKRQDHPEKCLVGTAEIIMDAADLRGFKKRSMKKRQSQTDYSKAEQQGIYTALRSIISLSFFFHTFSCYAIIDNYDLLRETPFAQPLGQILRVLESSIDHIVFGIVQEVPTCAQDATEDKKSLDKALSDAVETYSN